MGIWQGFADMWERRAERWMKERSEERRKKRKEERKERREESWEERRSGTVTLDARMKGSVPLTLMYGWAILVTLQRP